MSIADNRPTSSESTSTELLRKVIDRDEEAWATFFDLYRGLITSRCRSMGVRPCDCSDIVQIVLERVHRAIPEFRRDRQGQGLRRWLRAITRNVIRDYFRALPPERSGYSRAELSEFVQAFGDRDRNDTPTDLPDSLPIAELRPILELVKLDYEQRTWDAFWRTAIDEEPTAIVAADLGMSTGTVRQARYKILKHLRLELSDLGEML